MKWIVKLMVETAPGHTVEQEIAILEREDLLAPASLATSLCACLIADACNIGPEPLIRADIPALRRARLSWVSQNFIRNETLTEANACLVAEQNRIPLVRQWGGGAVASEVLRL